MNPVIYILAESERQSATDSEYVGMMQAYRHIRACRNFVSELDIRMVAGLIVNSPSVPAYRRVPVVFSHGRPAVHHTLVPGLMRDLVEQIDDYVKMHDIGTSTSVSEIPATSALVKEFLCIHPFQDGNGRIASLLYNWLLDTLADPFMLPDYFNEKVNN